MDATVQYFKDLDPTLLVATLVPITLVGILLWFIGPKLTPAYNRIDKWLRPFEFIGILLIWSSALWFSIDFLFFRDDWGEISPWLVTWVRIISGLVLFGFMPFFLFARFQEWRNR